MVSITTLVLQKRDANLCSVLTRESGKDSRDMILKIYDIILFFIFIFGIFIIFFLILSK